MTSTGIQSGRSIASGIDLAIIISKIKSLLNLSLSRKRPVELAALFEY